MPNLACGVLTLLITSYLRGTASSADEVEQTSYRLSWMWSQTGNIRPALFTNLEMQALGLFMLSHQSGFKETPVVQLLPNKLSHHT